MFPLVLLQRLFGLASLALFGTGVWLVVEWVSSRDDISWARDDRWLYVGLGLLAWSFLGRFVMAVLLGRPGRGRPRLERTHGETLLAQDGSEIRLWCWGPQGAPVLVLTHGWGLDSTIWRDARDELGDRYRLVAWDLPGLGRSSQPADGRYSIERLAGDLLTVVDHVGGPVVLVGHSIGGMIVQTFCTLHPERMGEQVRGIVLVNTTHTNPLRTMILSRLLEALRRPVIEPLMRLSKPLQPLVWLMSWQGYLSGSTHLAMRVAGFGTRPTYAQLNQVAQLATVNPPAVQAKGNLAMFHWDVTPDLPRIAVPTMVMVGGRDIVTRPQAGERIAQTIQGARLFRIPDAGHMGPVERSRVYNTAIDGFAGPLLSQDADRPERIGAASV
jgi:pimeloyl-ACP methyl ester carboxylesterase